MVWIKLKTGIPAFLAALIFLVVEAVNIWGNVPQQQMVDFEIMSNAFMLIVAVGSFFWIGLPAKENAKGTIGNMLGNIAVSAIAFPMNIDVFAQTIRWEQFWKDIWDWHFLWITCAVVQVLFLSNLGMQLLARIQGILLWGEGIVKRLGRIVRDILDEIGRTEKHVKYVVLGGFILWGIYLYSQIRAKGNFATAFFDIDFVWKSVRFWIAWIILCLLIFIALSFFKRIDDVVRDIKKKWLAIAAMIIGLVLSIVKWPILLTVIVVISVAPMIFIVLIMALVRMIYKMQNGGIKDIGGTDQELKNEKLTDTIKWGDCIIVWIAFILIPFTIVCTATFCSGEGRQIAAQDWSQITTWLEFMNAALGTIQAICELFALS